MKITLFAAVKFRALGMDFGKTNGEWSFFEPLATGFKWDKTFQTRGITIRIVAEDIK